METLSSKKAGSGGLSSQANLVDVQEIRDDVIALKSGSLRAVLSASSINFDLKSTILTAVALGAFAFRLVRTAPGPARLVGQLHLSQWAALVLAVQGAISLGLAVSAEGTPHAALEFAAGLFPIAAAALVLRSEPHLALQLAAAALGLRAAFAFGHRPGWWDTGLAPDWFWLGQALYDLYVATLCSLCARAR